MHEAAFREMYEHYGGQILGRCRFLLRNDDDARDAAQDVFLKAIEHFPSFRADSQRSTWLVRIATNHCLNILRMRRNETRLAVAEGRVPGLGPSVLGSADRAERHALVRELVRHAPPEAAEIAILYFVDELTQDEIGAVVERSLPTVRKRLNQFISLARDLLGPEANPLLDPQTAAEPEAPPPLPRGVSSFSPSGG